MFFPTAPPHALGVSVAATLCALSLTAAAARAQGLPVTIQGPITVVQATTPATRSSSDAQIRSAVSAWAQAWAAQDVERYLASYAPAFTPPDGQSRKAWEALRRSRVSGPRSIQVSISGVEVTRHDDARAAATFRQDYRSDRYQDSVRKTLELVRDGERWLIVEERVVSVLPEADAAPAPEPKATPASKTAAPVAAPAPTPAPAPAPAPISARAISAGLGALQVVSTLGQPLRVEIDIISLRSNEIDNVRVRLAPHEAYRQAGLQRSSALTGAKLAIELRDGKPIVAVTTRDSVNEPILQLLVELEWGSGRLMREYAVLLDPPMLPPPVHTVMGPKPDTAAPAAARVSPPAVLAPPRPAPTAATPGVEYRVVQGDTLAKIAREHMPAGVTLDQMLMALYRANIGAFIDDDINRLLAGYTLTIPDRETVAAVDAEDARQAVLAQMGRSAETRRVIAETAPAAPAAAAPRAIPKPAPSPDQVKLSRTEKPKPSEVAARDDDRIARDRALAEAQSRIIELEKIVADLKQLLEIRNQRLAELEKRLAEVQAAPVAKPPAPKPAVEAPKPAVEAPKPAVEAPKPAPAPAKPKPAPTPPKPAAKPRPAPPPPAPEPGLVERHIGDLGDPVMLGGLGAVTLLLIGYGAYAWRKKKRQARSQLSEALLGTAVGSASALEAEAAAAEAESAAAAAAAAAQTDEADPLEEADVYLAYGRDAQAEELLREAVQKGDRRPIAYMKLLQIYAKRHDAGQFESTALKLRGLVAGEGADWDKAMALGRSIDPGNALYGQGEGAEVAPEVDMTEEPEVDFDLDAVMAPGQAEAEAPEVEADKTVDFRIDTTSNGSARTEKSDIDMTLDFDLGGATSEEPVAAEPEAPGAEEQAAPTRGGIDFDLGGITTEIPVPTQPAQPAPTTPAPESAAPESAEVPSLELSLEPEGGEPPAPAPEAAPKPPGAVDLSTISFDLNEVEPAGTGAGGGEVNSQEVATKLHLAKAYEEIGDHDGARELLNEVIAEGNAAQQAQAKEMLASLG
jgi:pilus assembly protein FimV